MAGRITHPYLARQDLVQHMIHLGCQRLRSEHNLWATSTKKSKGQLATPATCQLGGQQEEHVNLVVRPLFCRDAPVEVAPNDLYAVYLDQLCSDEVFIGS
jgi:hypothetical protein